MASSWQTEQDEISFLLFQQLNPDSLISMLTIFRIYNVADFFLQETACFEEPCIWSAAKGILDTLPLCTLSFRRWYKAQILSTIRMPETQMPLMSPLSQAALCLSLLIGILEKEGQRTLLSSPGVGRMQRLSHNVTLYYTSFSTNKARASFSKVWE